MLRSPLRWLSVHYAPRPDERPFMDRAETQERAGLAVAALLRLMTFWTWGVATATPRKWRPIYTRRRPLLG
jgi:hypothetical protein